MVFQTKVSFIVGLVVSSGPFHAFHVVFLPLEYIPTIPPHSTYVIVVSYFLKSKRARNILAPPFPQRRAGKTIDVYIYNDDGTKNSENVWNLLQMKKKHTKSMRITNGDYWGYSRFSN